MEDTDKLNYLLAIIELASDEDPVTVFDDIKTFSSILCGKNDDKILQTYSSLKLKYLK